MRSGEVRRAVFDPNDCPYLADVLALWENELPAARTAEVRAHAAACPECRAELRELRRFSAVLQAGDPAEPLAGVHQARLKDDLLRRAAADLRPIPAPRRWAAPRWLPWLGLAAAAGALAIALFGPRAQPTPVPEMVKVPPPPRQLQHTTPMPVDRDPGTPPLPEPVLVRAAPAPRPAPRLPVPAPRAERRVAAVPSTPAPRERLVIDVQVAPQPELPPSGTLTLIATGASASSDATRVILRTVEEEIP